MNTTDHTFAVLAYKSSPYLEECIKSVLAQTVKSTVYISTSTPNEHIFNIGKQYGIAIKVNEQKPGIATDWQFALDNCDTQYVTLAHQDDLYYEQYAELLLKKIDSSLIAFCNYEEIIDDEQTRRYTEMLNTKRLLLWPFLFKNPIYSTALKKMILRFGSSICCPSVMYNMKMCGNFKFDGNYKNDLDWDAWLRLTNLKGGFSYSRKVLMAHRIHEDSETTHQIASCGRANEDRELFGRMWGERMTDFLCRHYSKSYESNDKR